MFILEAASAWFMKGEACKQSGDLESAFSCYLTALELSPWYLEAYIAVSNVFCIKGQYGSALKWIDRAEERLRNHPWLMIERGNVFKSMDMREKALKIFEKAFELYPCRFESELYAVQLLFEMRRFDEYCERTERLTMLVPDCPEVMMESVRCAKIKSVVEEAANIAVSMVEKFPEFLSGVSTAVECLREAGRGAEADELEKQQSPGVQ